MNACPNCSAVWGFEEVEDLSCGACGYPDNNNDDGDFEPDDELCPSCGGRNGNHRSGCSEDDDSWY